MREIVLNRLGDYIGNGYITSMLASDHRLQKRIKQLRLHQLDIELL